MSGRRILELGPLEAGHTTMLLRADAESVLAIEGNTRAYLKCLIVKELLDLHAARFLCGDFMAWMRDHPDSHFDLVVASGVLYHMQNPVEMIELASRAGDRLYVWSHYFDPELIRPDVLPRFTEATPTVHAGFHHTRHRHNYGEDLQTTRFWGSGDSYSSWLSKDDIIGAVEHFGMTIDDLTLHDDVGNGPSLEILAARR